MTYYLKRFEPIEPNYDHYKKIFFTTGNIIEGQLYQICIRQEVGTCSIAYSVNQGLDFVFQHFFNDKIEHQFCQIAKCQMASFV